MAARWREDETVVGTVPVAPTRSVGSGSAGWAAYRVRAAVTKTATKMAKSASIAGVADGSAICGHFRIA